MFVLHQNPFYDHYIRHKTHTSIQNKLNGESSSDNKSNLSQLSTTQPYSRLIYPQSFIPHSSSTSPTNRCYNDMKYILDEHARLAQRVLVR